MSDEKSPISFDANILRLPAKGMPVRIEAGLYRMAQEELNNVMQHAEASHARLRLVTTPSEVRLIVDDDGRGFDAPAAPQGRFGLLGLSERARHNYLFARAVVGREFATPAVLRSDLH